MMHVSGIKVLSIVLLLSISTLMFSQKQMDTIDLSKKTIVYIFLSETCPICQSYSLTLNKLYESYRDENILFIGLFPNYYSDQGGIDAFKKKYKIQFPVMMDMAGGYQKEFSATITPEVFVKDSSGQVLYSGRIDDSFYALGKRRNIIKSTELADVLYAITHHESVKTLKTLAVGCIISSNRN